ncbi:unnamed protein product [Phaeothamnion confervicola]
MKGRDLFRATFVFFACSRSSAFISSGSAQGRNARSQPHLAYGGGAHLATRIHQTRLQMQDDEPESATLSPPMQDWREFRAKLAVGGEEEWQAQLKRNQNPLLADVPTWAHTLPGPEKGCLLLASPEHFKFGQQTYFHQAVIFLAEHGPSGSAGFILNRPTQYKIGQATTGLEELSECPLYMGGDVGQGTVQLMHPFGGDRVRDAHVVIPGVSVGGSTEDVKRLVRDGEASPEQFRFFLALCGWGPGQLEKEVERGVWYTAAVSKEVVLKQCIGLPVPLWREVLQLLGGKYSLIARAAYDDL